MSGNNSSDYSLALDFRPPLALAFRALLVASGRLPLDSPLAAEDSLLRDFGAPGLRSLTSKRYGG